MRLAPFIAGILMTTTLATAQPAHQYPPPPTDVAPWPITMADAMTAVSAADLLDKPAGRHGPVVARDGHFYTGETRIRFWGVNLCFGGNFPTHANADLLAERLAKLGINAVRFHHMDNQAFPGGIFAGPDREKLSEEALDRLDYLVAALKKQGIYSNINLHVSRQWARAKQWPDHEKLDSYDKVLDIFHPELIAANKQYARDLLTHVNKYTGNRYADEPAVCMVEINNEDTLFLWGGERRLATLPPRYAAILQQLWNQWLLKRYGSRDKLAAAWNVGIEPAGENLLTGPWHGEPQLGGEMTVESAGDTHSLNVSKVTKTDWHIQFLQPGLKLRKGQFYTVTFKCSVSPGRTVALGVGQAHAPWKNLGLSAHFRGEEAEGTLEHRYGFIATADEDNARLSFTVGQATGKVTLSDIRLFTGGQEGLRDDEDPAQGTVRRQVLAAAGTPARKSDWYRFLQHTDESYWLDMYDFLRKDLGVKAPITGTIALGPLGTVAQAKMDFVDTHAYWDHPQFPGKGWDPNNWLIDNDSMTDDPAGATFWSLASARVAGKPFTVTEYNHSAPNEWAAECVPMIASYAALQDWDGIFLFAYGHGANYDAKRISSFFDIEGNPTKMPMVPLGARLFLGGGVQPIQSQLTLHPTWDEMLANPAPYHSSLWPFIREVKKLDWQSMIRHRYELTFEPTKSPRPKVDPDQRLTWTSAGPRTATGRFAVVDKSAIVFAGFPGGQAIDLGPLKIGKLDGPFVSLMLVPADPKQTIDTADRLLLAVVARATNADMKWSDDRRTVSTNWGKSPAFVEPVKGELSLAGNWKIKALKPDGAPGDSVPSQSTAGHTTVTVGSTLWYELTR